MHKYNIGDCVRIKENFWEIKPTIILGINNSMKKMVGEEYIIKCIVSKNRPTQYRFVTHPGKDWAWDVNWLEPASTFTIEVNELDEILKGI